MRARTGTGAGLADERREAIVALLADEGRVVASALADRLGVSTDTVQRDLVHLEDRGLLRRVRGGALPSSPGPVDALDRQEHDLGAKTRIAAAAWTALDGHATLGLAGGSTTRLVAERAPTGVGIVAMTSSPSVADALVGAGAAEAHLVGGRLDPRSRTLVGPAAVDAFRRFRPDAVVVSACSIDPGAGVTMQSADEAAVVEAMVVGAGRVVVLATAERLGTAAPFLVAALDDIDVLVTDAPATGTAAYAERGITVVHA
jgi:DeoR/GlpR family transcriptional regulator of sugar metabolism